MRSQQLAELAGVTVRTLRHYHRIGLLDEPARDGNGYRRYTVQHLATVLRIVGFTDLGVPLAAVREAMGDGAATEALLDRIDRRAVADIERLTARRRIIAELRDAGAPPDLPPALIPYAALLRLRAGASARDEAHEREQLALVRRFSGDAAMPWLVTALERLARSADRWAALADEFADLPDDAAEERRQDLATRLADLLAAAVPLDQVPVLGADATALLLDHQHAHRNAAQRLVWAQVARDLRQRAAGAGAAGPR